MKIGEGDLEIRKIEGDVTRRDVDEFGGTRKWKRAEEDGVDDAKDRGVGANAQGQGQDGNGGEGRIFAEHAQTEADVL